MRYDSYDGTWMHPEPSNPDAWPDYRTLAGLCGHDAARHIRAALAMARSSCGVTTDPVFFDSLVDHAVENARAACRPAWIVIFGAMTPDELRNEGF